MGVGGDESSICNVGPPSEVQSTVAEGGKGKGGADWVEGVGEWRESADYCEQGSVVGGLGVESSSALRLRQGSESHTAVQAAGQRKTNGYNWCVMGSKVGKQHGESTGCCHNSFAGRFAGQDGICCDISEY